MDVWDSRNPIWKLSVTTFEGEIQLLESRLYYLRSNLKYFIRRNAAFCSDNRMNHLRRGVANNMP